ncbi:Protein CBG07708 [Caenorhabditis briggsae]|uniref:Protein CBG07708 n=1 Tax=Caenorhabditis briggsae TaxID=6238 RepID=A8X488_CAEBR|nr:Protein CBG07708 [Caenorhabditis briggsae]CAP27448.1 Protein CBG07708 [Caenorhabditis briggsae]
MGHKTSKNEKVENHVAFPNAKTLADLPNITITHPTPIYQPDTPNPFTVPPPTPRDSHSLKSFIEETPILIASGNNSGSSSPPRCSPPPPPTIPPPADPAKDAVFHHEETRKHFGASVLTRGSSPLPPKPDESHYAPPVIKRPIYYAKDKIELYEALNTRDRNPPTLPPIQKKKEKEESAYAVGTPHVKFDVTKNEKKKNHVADNASVSSVKTTDDYPIYNILADYNYSSGKNFNSGAFPIDMNRKNFGFCGRSGSGKSWLINSLRGLNNGDPQSAGRSHCDRMEPFRFIEGELQQTVLWEIPYPRTFSSSSIVFDANMGFEKFYESHKLKLFKRLFILIPDGAPTDEDITFARVALSRRTSITFLITKSDDDMDAENRENGTKLDQAMKRSYETSARLVFSRYLLSKAQILNDVELLFVNAPTTRNLVSGTVGYLHYLMNEERLLELLDLSTGCHYELEVKLRREREESGRPANGNIETYRLEETPQVQAYAVSRPTILADAGFEISFGTDDRIYQSLEPKTMVRRAGKTCFNYGFIGGRGVGKSSLIDAMRGMSSKNPLSATKLGKPSKNGSCEKFEFDDTVLKYSVTLYELSYPKKISSYFEFVDLYNVASFTALFILVDQTPSEQDLAFAKIAYRRNATILFLISKCDKKLAARSRSDEIPVCDLLKQRYIDKALNKFDSIMASKAAELRGRVNVFFVSAPVFKALRMGDPHESQFVLHERAMFDFLKSRRMIADMLDDPPAENAYAQVDLETAGVR